MATATIAKVDNRVPLYTDKIVCRLDLFPELVQALHHGDVLTGRLFCAQLFDCDGQRNLRMGERTPSVLAAMKPH